MGLYGSQYDYVIHVALITNSHVSLITSFQPPLATSDAIRTQTTFVVSSLVPRPLPDFILQLRMGCEIKSGSGLGTRLHC